MLNVQMEQVTPGPDYFLPLTRFSTENPTSEIAQELTNSLREFVKENIELISSFGPEDIRHLDTYAAGSRFALALVNLWIETDLDKYILNQIIGTPPSPLLDPNYEGVSY